MSLNVFRGFPEDFEFSLPGSRCMCDTKHYAIGRFALRTSPPHCPQAMGLSERFNRILGEKTRALLKERKLERSFWEDAMKIIVYVQNRILNEDQLKTPFELMNGFKPNLSNLRIFEGSFLLIISLQKFSGLRNLV
jgi:hypothetical protein